MRLRLAALAAFGAAATLVALFWPRIAREGGAAAKANLLAAAGDVLASPDLQGDAAAFARSVVAATLADPGTHAAALRAVAAALADPATAAVTQVFLREQLVWLAAQPWFSAAVAELLAGLAADPATRDALVGLARRALEAPDLRDAGAQALVAAFWQAFDDKPLQARAERWVWEVVTPGFMRGGASGADLAAAAAAHAKAQQLRAAPAAQQAQRAVERLPMPPATLPQQLVEAEEPAPAPAPATDAAALQSVSVPAAAPPPAPRPPHVAANLELAPAVQAADDAADQWWRSIDAARRVLARRPFPHASFDGGFGEALSAADWKLATALDEAGQPLSPLAAFLPDLHRTAVAFLHKGWLQGEGAAAAGPPPPPTTPTPSTTPPAAESALPTTAAAPPLTDAASLELVAASMARSLAAEGARGGEGDAP